MDQKAIASSGQLEVSSPHIEVSYRTVVSSGQFDKDEQPRYDRIELQRAVDARNDWVRAQLGRYAGQLDEPTDDFVVTINGEQWHVVECWSGDLWRGILLQNGRNYLMRDEFWGEWMWVEFAVDATDLHSSPPRGYEPFPLVNEQRARARMIMLGLWS